MTEPESTEPELSEAFFATQTHLMTADLLDALDTEINFRDSPDDEMAVWFGEFLAAVNEGEEFTVTAEQARWMIDKAHETFEVNKRENDLEEDEGPNTLNPEAVALITETFDDFANFLRMSQSESSAGDIARVTWVDDQES